MTATDELRRLLDKRGVEYEGNKDVTRFFGYDGFEVVMQEDIDGKLDCLTPLYLTPEQAVEATLGRGTCHAESDLSEWVCSACQCWIPLGLTPENIQYASEWRYCPHCGAEVKAVSDDER